MGHDHRHDPTGGARTTGDGEQRVFWALLITGSFMVAEVAGGIISGSLALLADAGHMLTDTAALALSWYAFRVSRRPSTPLHSYGQHRFQVLAAFVNGATLIGIAAWIAIEATRRLFAPVEILGGTMLVIAVLGLAANIAAFVILHRGDRENLNVRGAALHVLGDLLGSAGAIVAAVVILLTGWTPIDPILSVLVALLIVRSAWSLISKSWHVLMEGTPPDQDIALLRTELVRSVDGVRDVHHVHVWSLTPERRLITLHANIAQDADHDKVLHRLQDVLAERFGLSHATIQIERSGCTDDYARK
ncbi:MAG: cation diffusion facilitator family transporter [Rhodospirillales bacterium]|nr:cation diffusion facilitator family transporter [Rhodospirillales bacterium]